MLFIISDNDDHNGDDHVVLLRERGGKETERDLTKSDFETKAKQQKQKTINIAYMETCYN